jgi:hypothetical protein
MQKMQEMQMKRTPKTRRLRSAFLACAVVLLAASGARADEYDPKRAGHPLRIVAYVLHPIGVAVDYLVLRPAHWAGSHEPLRTIFGHTD